MRKLIATLSILALLAGLAAVTAFATTPRVSWHVGTSKTVKIRHGGSVTWVWAGDASHNVRGKGFHSGFHTKKGATYTHRFRTKGTFKIVCDVHPGSMKTVVKVS
jgi:plastocyanin